MFPILLIHGFPFDATMWEEQTRFLRSRKYHVICPNLPGFGGTSAKPEGSRTDSQPPPTIESFAQAIHQEISRLGSRAIVAGLSMGGYVLLSLLRQYPQDVAGAVLMDTRAETDTPEARARRVESVEQVRQHGTSGLIDSMMPRLFAPGTSSEVKARGRAIMERQLPQSVMAAQLAMANRRDQTGLLPTIATPTLILVGTEDIITPPASARLMHQQIAGSELVEIPNAGHMTPMEAPDAVNETLLAFVNKLNKNASS